MAISVNWIDNNLGTRCPDCNTRIMATANSTLEESYKYHKKICKKGGS